MKTAKDLLKMKRVPREALDTVQTQLEGALQIIAALVLTDEEVIAIKREHDSQVRPDNMRGWAEGMREDLMADRPTLVEALRRHGFLTNTHAGFPLGALESPPVGRSAVAALNDAEALLVAYAEGEGEKREAGWLRDALMQRGHAEVYADYVWETWGRANEPLAQLERMLKESRQ